MTLHPRRFFPAARNRTQIWSKRLRFPKNWLHLLVCGIVTLAYSGCAGKRGDQNATTTTTLPLVEKIRSAKYVEDIFTADTVRLTIPSAFVLGRLDNIHVSDNGSLFLVDTRFAGSVLRFDQNGRFRGQFGKQGKGPGEYQLPRFITTCGNEIYVGDVGLSRISVFDTSGAFLRSFRVQGLLDGVYAGGRNTVVTHQLRVPSGGPTVHVYTKKGKLLHMFGQPSDSYRRFESLAKTSSAPYLACLGGLFYQMDYTDYHVIVYSGQGKVLKIFGTKPRQYRSPLTEQAALIPGAKYATAEYIAKLQDFVTNHLSKCSLAEGILTFPPGIVATLFWNLEKSGFDNRLHFSFYTASGNLIRSDIPFKSYPVSWEKRGSLLISPPDKIVIYEYENDSEDTDQKIKLVILKPQSTWEGRDEQL